MSKIYVFDPGNFVPDYNYSFCTALKENYPNKEVIFFSSNWKEWNQANLNFKIVDCFFNISRNINMKNELISKILKGVEYLFNLLFFLFYSLKEKPDVIHIQWSLLPLIDIIICHVFNLFNIKLVYTVHNILPHENKWYHKYIYGRLYRLFDKLIIHTEPNKEEFISIFGNEFYKKMIVIPHGDYNKIYCQTNEKNDNSNDKLKFLFFGLIREYKGLDVLLNALKNMKKCLSINEVIFKIYGNPLIDFSKYQKIIDNNELQEYLDLRLEYIPEEEIPNIFNECDLIVLPYKKIYQSGVALLAFTFNLPIVASNVGGIGEIVTDEKSGILFEPNNSDELEKILREIINNPQMARDMSNYIEKTVSDKYSWDNIAKKTNKVYENLKVKKEGKF